MDILREHLWLWVILGMVVVSLLISFIFLMINRCIAKEDEYNTSQPASTPQFYTQSSKYHLKDIEDDLPPLPPRTQFLTETDVENYENFTEVPDYLKVEDVVLPPPPPYQQPETTCNSRDSLSTEEYDDIGDDFDDGEDEDDYDDVG